MDELKLNLGTNFMRKMVSKIINKAIRKKLGSDIDVLVNNLAITAIDGKIHVHFDADAEISNEEFVKLVKTIGLD